MIRRLAAAFAAFALVLILAVPAIAGGWADIVVDAQTTTEPPVQGEPIDVGFRVMQHGETAAGWETPTVHFTNTTTGMTIDVIATNDRPDGHFTATAALPEAGPWTWRVTLKDLASEHAPVPLTVAPATAPAPTPAAIEQPPVNTVVTLAVLSVAAVAVFAVFWRTQRPRGSVKVSPASRGVDPA